MGAGSAVGPVSRFSSVPVIWLQPFLFTINKRAEGDSGYGRYSGPVNEAIARPIILVVDDAPALRFLCRVNLELEGYEVVEAGTLDEARELIDREPVSLVLLDLQIGAERSEPLLVALSAREPRIPVVVVTGSAEIDSGELKMDADAVLAKPFTIDELLIVVRSLTGRAPVAG